MTSRHKWSLDLGADAPRRLDVKPIGDVPYSIETQTTKREADQTSLKIRKSWETAKSLRPVVTMGGLYWMTPNQPNLIFLSIIFTTLAGHISAMLEVNNVFEPFEDDKKQYSLLPQKILYILVQIAALGIGIYKLAQYGLLPTTAADWLPYHIIKLPLERAFGASV